MAEFPILVRFRTDHYPTMVPVDSEDTVAEAAETVVSVVENRVQIDHDRPIRVVYEGEFLPDSATISDVLDPVEYVELQYGDEPIPEGFGKSHPVWSEESMLEAHPEHAKPE